MKYESQTIQSTGREGKNKKESRRRPRELEESAYEIGPEATLRFWKSVNKNGPAWNEEGACWVWIKERSRGGYGRFPNLGNKMLAHRVSYYLEFGSIAGMCVLHKCDNPSCVRPSHLFKGTPKDNFNDMVAKGRGGAIKKEDACYLRRPERTSRGATHFSAKLTETIVTEARAQYALGITQASLARKYMVHLSTMNNAVLGKTWKHVSTAPADAERIAAQAKEAAARFRQAQGR